MAPTQSAVAPTAMSDAPTENAAGSKALEVDPFAELCSSGSANGEGNATFLRERGARAGFLVLGLDRDSRHAPSALGRSTGPRTGMLLVAGAWSFGRAGGGRRELCGSIASQTTIDANER